MRRFFPQTLPVWVLSIVITGLLVSQIATLSIIARDRRAANETLELYRLTDRAVSLVRFLHAAPAAERRRLAAGLSNPTNALAVSDRPSVATAIAADDTLAELEDVIVGRLARYGVLEARVRRVKAAASRKGGQPAAEHVMSAAPAGAAGVGMGPGSATNSPNAASDVKSQASGEPEPGGIGDLERDLVSLAADFSTSDRLMASVEFSDGQWLNFDIPVTPLGPLVAPESWPPYLIVAGLVLGLSIWSLRRLTAPYRALEAAVGRLGDNLRRPPLDERGSREYRSAARTINAMQARLLDYVEDRELVAAALAHDLRTPMTRLRLRLEQVEDDALRATLAHDLAAIDGIARSVVDLARTERAEEEPERLDFRALVETLADAYPGIEVEAAEGTGRDLVCRARPVALTRIVTNLLDNTATYGRRATVRLSAGGDGAGEARVVMTILDEGPGIPEDRLQSVFRAFSRVEPSRSRETGGLGLGLTIARTLARQAGGDIELANRPEGGLKTVLWLPRDQGNRSASDREDR